MSEADYAGLVTGAHQQLHAPVILCSDNLARAARRGLSRQQPGRPRAGARLAGTARAGQESLNGPGPRLPAPRPGLRRALTVPAATGM